MNEDYRRQLLRDFPLYAETCLKIRTKEGDIKPFVLNKAQVYLHQELENQRKLTGRIRAIILKGRQQGCSTYVSGRYYHQVTQRFGARVFILTHREDATNNLYKLVQRYHENIPDFIKPSTGISNAKELYFDDLDSGYGIGTAGGGKVGRSDTIQLLHGSEVGFWENTDEISTGIMQTVADVKDTEIILESTANGIGNMFHRMAINAMHGLNEYKLIFIPWFWQDEYRLEVPKDFKLTDEEQEYKQAYNLDDKQIVWRRNKIANFTGGEWQFKQEYPATPNEAFQTSSEDSLIQPQTVIKARTAKNIQKGNQLVIGVDPAHKGRDRTAIVFRDGRVQYKHEIFQGLDTMEVVGRIIQMINHYRPEKVFVDMGGIGAGIYDRLKELNYTRVVVGVNFGSKSDEADRYLNKRAEMWGKMGDWLKDQGGVKIEDNDELHSDLIAPRYTFDSQGRLKIEPKDEIKKRYLKSPDLGDALALTFAYNIPNQQIKEKYGMQRTYQAQSNWDVFNG
mgnify:FL=1|jgi:hypothetical protein